MLKCCRRVGVALAAVAVWHAASPRAQTPLETALPPLIDRELIFGDPEITGAQVSPDGAFIAFVKPYNGTRNVWVKRADQHSS